MIHLLLFPSRTHAFIAGRARLFAATGIAAALVASSGLANAQTASPPGLAADCSTLHLNLANPTAGDTLLSGGYVVEGFAFDAAATTQQGTGVDRVELFLDDRDTGGLSLGTADLGVPSTFAVPSPQFGMAGFRIDVTLPEQSGGHTLFAYARSSVTHEEQVLSVPILVGADPEAEAQPGIPVATMGTPLCPPTASTQATVSSTSATVTETSATVTGTPATVTSTPATVTGTPETIQATPVPATAVAQAPLAAPMQLTLSNPQPGANLQSGAYSITGTALDSRATQGSGIDRIEFFLDDREQGGLFLGQAAVQASMPLGSFTIEVDLPEQDSGRTLFAYAYSSVTDDVAVVAIPVTVGTIAE